MEPILLYTDRLIIRNLEDKDWQGFRALNMDAEVGRYVREVQPEADILAKFHARLAPWKYEEGGWLTLVIENLNGDFIGLTGFYCQDSFSNRAEVGYMIAPSEQGKGYASESLQAVIDWGCLRYQIHKFVGCCAVGNIGSKRVMEKCGFRQEGLLRENYRIGDVWVDEYVMGLVADER